MATAALGFGGVILAMLLSAADAEEQWPAEVPAQSAATTPALSSARPNTFAIEGAPGAVYTVTVWKSDPAAHAALLQQLSQAEFSDSTEPAVLLSAFDKTAIVRIVHWAKEVAADPFLGGEPVNSVISRARKFTVVDSSLAEGGERELRIGSAVQWSEFLMREPRFVAELSPMVSGMTSAMAEGGGAPDLRTIVQLKSEDDQSIGLLGLWRTRDGFEVFARENTFGETGYWEPYAANEHWMMEVVSIR